MFELTNQLNEIAEGVRSLSQSIDQRRLREARALARAGKYTLACQEIEGHDFFEPWHQLEALLLLAKVFAQQGMYDKADTYFKRVLRVDSENREALLALAAISKQFSHPPLQRVWSFLATSLLLITLAGLLVFFISSRIREVDSRIVGLSTEARDRALQQTTQITADLQALRKTYADKLANATSVINSLKQSIVRSEEQALQREQARAAQFNSTFVEVRNQVSRNRKTLDAQLNSLETNTIQRISNLSKQNEGISATINQRLVALESSLVGFREELQAMNKVAEHRETLGIAQRELAGNRFRNLEEQLSGIQTVLSEIQAALLLESQKNK